MRNTIIGIFFLLLAGCGRASEISSCGETCKNGMKTYNDKDGCVCNTAPEAGAKDE